MPTPISNSVYPNLSDHELRLNLLLRTSFRRLLSVQQARPSLRAPQGGRGVRVSRRDHPRPGDALVVSETGPRFHLPGVFRHRRQRRYHKAGGAGGSGSGSGGGGRGDFMSGLPLCVPRQPGAVPVVLSTHGRRFLSDVHAGHLPVRRRGNTVGRAGRRAGGAVGGNGCLFGTVCLICSCLCWC